MTPTSELPAVVRAIDAVTAAHINPDATPGTVQWAAAVAAQNLRDAGRLFDDAVNDLGRVS